MSGITIATAENLLVRIEAADGRVGWGEAASAPTMTGDTLGGLVAAVRDHLAPLLIGQDAFDRPALMPALRRALDRQHRRAFRGRDGAARPHRPRQQHAADRCGRAEAAAHARSSRCGSSAMPRPTQDIAEARAKEREGFHFFKLKIGVKPLADEIAATLAVREALGREDAALRRRQWRADARERASATSSARGRRKLAFVEQPLAHDDLAGLKALARAARCRSASTRASIRSPTSTANARAGAAGVSLKLIKLGGFTTAYEAAKLCRRLRPQDQRRGQDRGVEHRHRGGRASRLRGAERRLGREPHALLSRRGHRAAAAARSATAPWRCRRVRASASRSTRRRSSGSG